MPAKLMRVKGFFDGLMKYQAGVRTLGYKTSLGYYAHGEKDRFDQIFIRHHGTDILTYTRPSVTRPSAVILDNGGWYSATTKARFNWYLNEHNVSVFQLNHEWFVDLHDRADPIPYRNRMSIVIHSLEVKSREEEYQDNTSWWG